MDIRNVIFINDDYTISQFLVEVFRFRYTIYCEREGFLPINQSGLDIDEYDVNSKHFIITQREVVRGVGRVILPPNTQFKQEIRLYPEYEWLYNERSVVEISRLGSYSNGLLKILVASALTLVMLQKTNLFIGILEPRLAGVLIKMGIPLDMVGAIQDYYGKRAPYLGRMSDIQASLFENNLPLYEMISGLYEQESKG